MVVRHWQITSQELLTDLDFVPESAKSVSTSRTGSHARGGVVNLMLVLVPRFPKNELRIASNA